MKKMIMKKRQKTKYKIGGDKFFYVLALFEINVMRACQEINRVRKRRKPYTVKELFWEPVTIETLLDIDRVFDMGVLFYLDEKRKYIDKKDSIFFRHNPHII